MSKDGTQTSQILPIYILSRAKNLKGIACTKPFPTSASLALVDAKKVKLLMMAMLADLADGKNVDHKGRTIGLPGRSFSTTLVLLSSAPAPTNK